MNLYIITTKNWEPVHTIGSIVEMEPIPESTTAIRFGHKRPFTTCTGVENFHTNTQKVTKHLVTNRLQNGDIEFFINLAKFFKVGSLQIGNYKMAKEMRQFGEISMEEYSIAKNKAIRGLYEETKKLYK